MPHAPLRCQGHGPFDCQGRGSKATGRLNLCLSCVSWARLGCFEVSLLHVLTFFVALGTTKLVFSVFGLYGRLECEVYCRKGSRCHDECEGRPAVKVIVGKGLGWWSKSKQTGGLKTEGKPSPTSTPSWSNKPELSLTNLGDPVHHTVLVWIAASLCPVHMAFVWPKA